MNTHESPRIDGLPASLALPHGYFAGHGGPIVLCPYHPSLGLPSPSRRPTRIPGVLPILAVWTRGVEDLNGLINRNLIFVACRKRTCQFLCSDACPAGRPSQARRSRARDVAHRSKASHSSARSAGMRYLLVRRSAGAAASNSALSRKAYRRQRLSNSTEKSVALTLSQESVESITNALRAGSPSQRTTLNARIATRGSPRLVENDEGAGTGNRTRVKGSTVPKDATTPPRPCKVHDALVVNKACQEPGALFARNRHRIAGEYLTRGAWSVGDDEIEDVCIDDFGGAHISSCRFSHGPLHQLVQCVLWHWRCSLLRHLLGHCRRNCADSPRAPPTGSADACSDC